MVEFHGSVSHRLARNRTLAKWRAGKIETATLCDADFLLLSAARFHGSETTYSCPVCEAEGVIHVLWIYGDQLGRMSGSARSLTEIEALTDAGREFTVHTVEVCVECRWNYLLHTTIAAPSTTPAVVDSGYSAKIGQASESLSGSARYNSAEEKINPAGLNCMVFFEEDF